MTASFARLAPAPVLLLVLLGALGASPALALDARDVDAPAVPDCHALDGPENIALMGPDEVLAITEDLAYAPMGAPGDLPSTNDVTCSGIRPGAWIITGNSICTLAFMFTNGVDIFASTAGHCTGVGQSPRLASGLVIGTTVFSVNGGVGNDFALIRVNPANHQFVNPEMCFWAGPMRVHTGTVTGQALFHDGHGAGVVSAPPRPRVGLGSLGSTTTFAFVGAGVPGDSGSAIETSTGGAVGVITHLGVGSGTNFGTPIARGLALAGQPGLTLLTAQNMNFI